MAAPLQIYGQTSPQEPAGFVVRKATPPEKQIQLPWTLQPPAMLEEVTPQTHS